jgi:hypothetical protein
MSAITPEILYKLEDNMQAISENEMARITLGENLWWKKLVKEMTSQNRKETKAWILSTAQIYPEGKGGNTRFDDQVTQAQEFEHTRFGTGLRIDFDQLTDNDGKGFDFAGEWASQTGALTQYFPQEQAASMILNGEVATAANPFGAAYDGKAFFAKDHPLNPYKTSVGTYANLMSGAASGIYPGACPIDDTVTIDQARANVQKVISYVASIKMPNGKTPRRLKCVGILHPSTLAAQVQEITKAKFIAQAAPGGGGGSGDVEAVIRNWAFGEPIDSPELLTMGNGTTDLTSWYMVTQQVQSTQLGALVYSVREPFAVRYWSRSDLSWLDTANAVEYHLKGRNANAYGHPYGLIKVKAA